MKRLHLTTWLRGTAIALGAFAAGGIAMMSLSAFASDAPDATTTTTTSLVSEAPLRSPHYRRPLRLTATRPRFKVSTTTGAICVVFTSPMLI